MRERKKNEREEQEIVLRKQLFITGISRGQKIVFLRQKERLSLKSKGWIIKYKRNANALKCFLSVVSDQAILSQSPPRTLCVTFHLKSQGTGTLQRSLSTFSFQGSCQKAYLFMFS
jgi:hypothetical protein